MTFQDIEQQWQWRNRNDALEEERLQLWEELSGPSRGWFTACRTAVADDDLQSILAWLNPADEDKQACLNFDRMYAAVARAHLLCAQAILQAARPEEGPQIPDDDAGLQALADQVPPLSWPLNWWRDIVHALHPLETASRALASETLWVLLVDSARPQRPGVVAALTLDLLPAGSGMLYPAVPMAYVYRDDECRIAEQTVCTYLRNKGVWRSDWDVRWEITRLDGPLLPLRGGSLGAALALGVAKLCAGGGAVLCEGLRTLYLQQITLTATCTATGELGAVNGLEAKFDAACTSPHVRWIVVSTGQRHIQPWLDAPPQGSRIFAAATLEEAVQHLATAQAQTTDGPLVGVPPHLVQAARQQLSAAQQALQAGEETAPQKLRLALHAFGIELDTPALVPGFLPRDIAMILTELRDVSALPHVPEATRHQVARLLEACRQPPQGVQRHRIRVCLIAPEDVTEERTAAAAYIEALEKDPLFGWVRVEVVSWGDTSLAACDIVLVLCWAQMGRVQNRAASASADVTGQPPHADAARPLSLLEAVSQEAEYATRAAGTPRLYVYQRTPAPAIALDDPHLGAKQEELQRVQAFCARLRPPEARPNVRHTPYDTPDAFIRQWAQHLHHFLADALSAAGHPSDAEPAQPYRYLETFQPHEARYFRGREQEIQQLQALVSTSRFVTLCGPSGSGKSSLALAGVVPRLISQGWLSAYCRPQLNAVGALAQAPRLLTCATPDAQQHEDTSHQAIEQVPKVAGQQSLTEHVLTLLQAAPEQRLLLIVDQFEELFRSSYTQSQRHGFLQDLDRVVNSELPCCVLVTVRADGWDEVLSSEAGQLLPAIKDHQMALWRMPEAQVRQAIEEPAEEVGVTFEAGLVEHIVQAVGDERGQLPILQIVLTELFKKRRGRLMTHEAYQEIGEVSEAIANWADDVVRKVVQEEESRPRKAQNRRRIVKRLFKVAQEEELRSRKELESQLEGIFIQLVDLGDERRPKGTRRVATFAQLGNRPMVDNLVEKGLLRPYQGREAVEIAHDALIDHWPLMQAWVRTNSARVWFDTEVRRWGENPLTLPMMLVPCYAAVVGALTRPMFARFLGGTFMVAPFDHWDPYSVWQAVFHGLIGTWLGSLLFTLMPSKRVFFTRSGEISLRMGAWLALPGFAWGTLLLMLMWGADFPAGWGYLLTGPCWGIGVASGAYLADKMGGTSSDFSTSLGQRVVGAGIGTLGMLLAFVFIIGPFIGDYLARYMADIPSLVEAHARVRERAWAEACEQSVSVWAFLGFFARHLRKVYRGHNQ